MKTSSLFIKTTLLLVAGLIFSISAKAEIQNLVNKEVIYTWTLSKKCKIYYRKFDEKARHERTVYLKYIASKSDCNLTMPEVERYSFKTAGIELELTPTDVTKGVEIEKNETTAHLNAEISLHGPPIPGLKQKTMNNCDEETGVCSGELTVGFWNSQGQHIKSRHRMLAYKKDTPLKTTPVKNSAKKLFPDGTVPAETTMQVIRTNVEWLSGDKFQSDSCNALWLGEDTLQKPDKVNWGCGAAKSLPMKIDYLIRE